MLQREKVKELIDLMESLEATKANIKSREDLFKESIAGEVEIKKNQEIAIADLKEQLSSEALEEFKESGNKKLLGGIGIRETEKVSYDLKDAFNWAKEKDMFLQLDDKAFKKAVKSLGLDFVKTDKVASVTFPAKLEVSDV